MLRFAGMEEGVAGFVADGRVVEEATWLRGMG